MAFLTIRAEQMAVFQEEIVRRFAEGLEVQIRERFPVEAEKIGPWRIKEFVLESVKAGTALGLEGDEGIRFYVFLTVAFRPSFLERKATRWRGKYLKEEGASTETRLEGLIGAMEQDAAYEPFLQKALKK